MADPVRVQREESFQTSGPPAVLTVGYVNPDDLARAIRREMAAEVEIIRDDLRKGIDVDDALRWSHDRLTAPAPREPAQERQEAPEPPEPPQHAEAMADLLRELEGWKDGPNSSDDTRRKHWLMRRAAATIRALTPPTPTPDPLLPGLRHVRSYWFRREVLEDFSRTSLSQWLDAEIARREGGQ